MLDSGQSVFEKNGFAPPGLDLSWSGNAEIDLDHYAVYRGLSADFAPGPGNLIVSPADTFYFDGAWRWDSGYYYKVSAIDIHGNEGARAFLAPDGVTGVDAPETPMATYLAQNVPNPFNPATRIAFGLKAPAAVSLRIYDASGRLVRVLVEGDARRGAVRRAVGRQRLEGERRRERHVFLPARRGDVHADEKNDPSPLERGASPARSG